MGMKFSITCCRPEQFKFVLLWFNVWKGHTGFVCTLVLSVQQTCQAGNWSCGGALANVKDRTISVTPTPSSVFVSPFVPPSCSHAPLPLLVDCVQLFVTIAPPILSRILCVPIFAFSFGSSMPALLQFSMPPTSIYILVLSEMELFWPVCKMEL